MTTAFTPSSGNPANYLKYKTAVDALISIIKSTPGSIIDFSNLLYPRVSHATALNMIARSIRFNSSKPNVVALFSQLALFHTASQSDEEWWDVLGEIVEASILTLLNQKYNLISKQEEVIVVSDGFMVIADMTPKSMDVISWDCTNDCGEMHEVKKAVESKIPPRKRRPKPGQRKFKEKVVLMSNFKTNLELHVHRRSFVGVTTLLETTSQAKILISTVAPNANIDVLGRDSLGEWLNRKYF